MTASLFPQSAMLRALSPHWCFAKDGDPYAYELARRHYSHRRRRIYQLRQFVGPGRKLVLLSTDGKALFAWRDFIDDTQPKQVGWNCSIFRNEGPIVSSLLIMEAVTIVYQTWGDNRCYTLVNPAKIRSSNPGFCFKKAGWRAVGTSKTGKVILQYP